MSNLNFLSSESFYDGIYKHYTNIASKRQFYNSAVDRYIRAHPNFRNFIKIIDVGTGDGCRITKLFGGKAQISVIEESGQMCNILQKNEFLENVLEGRAEEIDIGALEGKFDLVTLQWNVLGHVESHLELLTVCHKLLKSGGYLIFDVNNPFNIKQYGVFSFIRNFIYFYLYPRNTRRFMPLELNGVSTNVSFSCHRYYVKILELLGFVDIRSTYFDYGTGDLVGRFSGQVTFDALKK